MEFLGVGGEGVVYRMKEGKGWCGVVYLNRRVIEGPQE